MTSQTKKFIEASDIIGLRLECADCRATLLLPLAKEINVARLRICPHCQRPWVRLAEGGSIETTISTCIQQLNILKDALQSGHFNGFSLALEIKIEKEEDSKPSASQM